MNDDELRASVLKVLNLTDAGDEMQEEALQRVESIANKRVALALPDLLSDEQLAHVDNMYEENKSDDEIAQWIQGQLPEYNEMMSAIIQDVAEEAARI